MKKTVLIAVLLVFVVGAALVARMLRPDTPPAPVGDDTPPPQLPVAGTRLPTTGDTSPAFRGGLTLASVDGGTVATRDFLKLPGTVADQVIPHYYYLGYHTAEGQNDPSASDAPPYIISYASDTQYFNVAILQEPIGAVRLAAEAYLSAALGISSSELCRLQYTVSTPERVNATFASRNLGFSQCPGAAALPQ